MSWAIWLAGAAILFVPGAYLVRAGRPKVVRVYLAACALLAICWVFGLGPLVSETLAAWPKALLAMLVPGTVVLAIWSAQSDRKRVMGSTREERDALATAAVLYGASQFGSDSGDTGDAGAGDVGGGDAGGGGF